MTTMEVNDLFRSYLLNFYSYLFGLNIMDLANKERQIIESAISNAECYELRASNVKKFPEMIKRVVGR